MNLNLLPINVADIDSPVSIPIRDLMNLNLTRERKSISAVSAFQSLLGI